MENTSLQGLIRAVLMESIDNVDLTNMRFDAEEIANFVTEYIKPNKIAVKPVSSVMFDYYLPPESKPDLDDAGFSSYRMEPSSNGEYLVIRWHKVD